MFLTITRTDFQDVNVPYNTPELVSLPACLLDVHELISYCMHLLAHWKTLVCLHTGMLIVHFAHCIMEYHLLHIFLLCEVLTSLVPRSSPALVLECLQCAKLTIWSHRRPGKKASSNSNCYIHSTPSLVLTPNFLRGPCTLIENKVWTLLLEKLEPVNVHKSVIVALS